MTLLVLSCKHPLQSCHYCVRNLHQLISRKKLQVPQKKSKASLHVSMQSRPVELAPKTIDTIQKYYTCTCIQAGGVCTQSIG
ncbi:unnamed protein product [Ixodes persulcatus]